MRSFTPILLGMLPVILAQSTRDKLFTVTCDPLTIQRSDPIVSPGEASSHVHVVVGGTGFKRTESNEDATKSKATTCNKKLDKSNYWIPQLYHQKGDSTFDIVRMSEGVVYYISRTCDYEAGKTGCDYTKFPRAPPKGLRMLTGNPTLRSYNSSDIEQNAISHMCLKEDSSPTYSGFPTESCLRLRSQVFFPSCWNGKDLDSPDHKSHMAYPVGGAYDSGSCPQTHPVAIYSLFYEFFYEVSEIKNFNRLVYAMGDATGYGLHGDFINGWTDQDALEKALPTCTGANGVSDPNCSLVLDGSAGSSSPQKPETSEPTEDVGLSGSIASLPGNNPVTGKLSKRIMTRKFTA